MMFSSISASSYKPDMRTLVLVVAASALVVAAGSAGALMGSSTMLDGANLQAASSDAPPYAPTLSGALLASRVERDLSAANAVRREQRTASPMRRLILDRVAFERSAGAVVARGSVTDPSGPRPLSAVVDAYDADRGYLVSSSAPVTTSDGVSTTFSVVLDDQDAFASFSVRFLNADMDELPVSTGEPAMTSVAPLLADDALHPADFPELGERLALLGYLQDRGATLGGAVALEVVIRFRRDHGMRGVARVTLADLLALRATAPAVRRTTDLSAY